VLKQYMHSPWEPLMEAASWILHYLKFSPGKGLLFSQYEHLKIEAYTNEDWVGSIMD
jgi:hypothetical protein